MRVYCDHRQERKYFVTTWVYRPAMRSLWPVEYMLCEACWDKACLLLLGCTLPPVQANFDLASQILKRLKREQIRCDTIGEPFDKRHYREFVKSNVRGIEASIIRR